MIYYDTTKMGAAKHRSGLMRLTSRLGEELGAAVRPVSWDAGLRNFVATENRAPVEFSTADWLLTVEMFSEAERPGITEFIHHPPCRLAAMFHDAIPVRFPHITWPQSVQRHPEYMKLLAAFDRTWAISAATREDFSGFWRWQGVEARGPVDVIALGADFDGRERQAQSQTARGTEERPALLCVGIVEPRKNQLFLLEVCEMLWGQGVDFELHVVGRINPHFGKPSLRRMKQLQRDEPRFHFYGAADDGELSALYSRARAVVCPTIAEGCGLPLLEALWRGVPCVASDLPVLRENAGGGGCLLARLNDAADWGEKLRVVLTNESEVQRLRQEAVTRALPRWQETAQTLVRALQ